MNTAKAIFNFINKRSNDWLVYSVRTPGGKLVYQYLKKPKKIPRCGQCKDKLRGIQPARPMERSRMCRRKKTVKRVYGGVLCHKCVKERYVQWNYNVQYIFVYIFILKIVTYFHILCCIVYFH